MEIKKTEGRIQQECVAWFRNKYCRIGMNPKYKIFHIPNQNQHKLYSIGVEGGVSDLCVLFEKGVSVWIEMKEPGKSQQPNQEQFEMDLVALGFDYYVCDNIVDFMTIISRYVNKDVEIVTNLADIVDKI
jgi:hypothetical protein